jgi:hypothetical protein
MYLYGEIPHPCLTHLLITFHYVCLFSVFTEIRFLLDILYIFFIICWGTSPLIRTSNNFLLLTLPELYQRKWNTWTDWIQEELQNKFYIISQEDKDQLDVQWKDGRKIWDHDRTPGLIFDRTKNKMYLCGIKINHNHLHWTFTIKNNAELGLASSGQGPVAGFCEHGNETSGSIMKVGYSLTSWVTINFSNNMLHHGVSKQASMQASMRAYEINQAVRHINLTRVWGM